MEKKQISNFLEKKISRKDAIKKTGYIALSSGTMMILLNKNAQGKKPMTSGAAKQGNNGFGNGHQPAPGGSLNNNGAENDQTPDTKKKKK